MGSSEVIGFIGLGVMGEPMCRNMAQRSGRTMLAYDIAPGPLERLQAHGIRALASIDEVVKQADIVFPSLPSGAEVEAVCGGSRGVLAAVRRDQVVVDLGTSPLRLTRELGAAFAERGVAYADAPVARTRQAAEQGNLAVMVGVDDDAIYARVHPLLTCIASEITRCGGIGAGQFVKIMNNMVLFQTVVALSEALAVARRTGIDGDMLFATLAKGSADSFALRNHGMKAVLPGVFPERAFSTAYALKDLHYALELAAETGLTLGGAELADRLLREAAAQGHADQYWPVVSRIIGRGTDP